MITYLFYIILNSSSAYHMQQKEDMSTFQVRGAPEIVERKAILIENMQKATLGDSNAQTAVGEYYHQLLIKEKQQSQGENKNFPGSGQETILMMESIKWYMRAESQGNPKAAYGLFQLFFLVTRENIQGDDRIRYQGVTLWKKAADSGFLEAQISLGYSYLNIYKYYKEFQQHPRVEPDDYLLDESLSRTEYLNKSLHYLESAKKQIKVDDRPLEQKLNEVKAYLREHTQEKNT